MNPATTKYQMIGRLIRTAREEEGMAQKTLAEAVGFESPTSISLIEAGERRVNIEDLEKIAQVLRRDITYFLGDPKVEYEYALRADPDLTAEDKKGILRFIELAKEKNRGR